MNNTKTIFKSLLIMIVAISLFTVSCSKDEGGTKTPTNPAKPITITAKNITAGFTGLSTITIGKMDFDFSSFDGNASSLTKTGVLAAVNDDTANFDKTKIEGKFTSGLKVSGATVAASAANTDNFGVDKASEITITITITPTSGNSFAADTDLKPYTKDTTDTKSVKVTLTLKPENGKKWNGAA